MTPFDEAPQYASANLSDAEDLSWRGSVDEWDADLGIRGWALMSDAPSESADLELTVGETRLIRLRTGLAHAATAAQLGMRVTPGFEIPPSVFAQLARLKPRRRDLPVRLRFAGTRVYFPGPDDAPTVGQLVDAWRAIMDGGPAESEADIDGGDRLLARLSAMRTAAEEFRDLPLHPSSNNDAGRIEAFHLSAGGQLWFIGWMIRGADTEFSALIVDRQKYPGGVATLHFERQDLASRYVGIVGLMDTGWTPPSAMKDFFVYCGPDARLQLLATAQTTLVALDAFLDFFKMARVAPVAGNADALSAVLTSGSHWMPGNALAAGIVADVSMDRLFLIPGFGCIAEGWAISPSKQVRSFQMKIAGCTLLADEASTYFRARPDLDGIFGGGTSIVARGGFVTVFRGALPPAAAGSPLLRVVYADGTSTVHTLEPKVLHRLNFLTDSAAVLRLYPSLRHEPFYPALLSTLQRQLHNDVAVRALVLSPARHVLVLRLPGDTHNRRLCFDSIAQFGLHASDGVGICLLADDHEGLTEAKLLFQELRKGATVPLSLFCLDDVDAGFATLSRILSQLQADRFIYADRGVALMAAGWAEALKFLNGGAQDIQYFGFIDDGGAPDRVNGAVTAACFGWTTAAFRAWLPSAPRLFRGVHAGNGLPAANEVGQISSAAAIRLERPEPSRLADILNEDALALYETSAELHA